MVGSLTDKVTILSPSNIPNEQGGFETIFTDYFTCWAKVETMQGLISLEYFKEFNKQPYKITIRYDKMKEVKGGYKLRWKSKEMKIHSVVPSKGPRDQFIELIAYYSD
jgi:SPP1 family predicted phage head-tail adaptor